MREVQVINKHGKLLRTIVAGRKRKNAGHRHSGSLSGFSPTQASVPRKKGTIRGQKHKGWNIAGVRVT